MFYQLGKLYVYDLQIELYDYSSESFATGNSAIDIISTNLSTDMLYYEFLLEDGTSKLLQEDGSALILEAYALENVDAQANNNFFTSGIETDSIIDFSEQNPFGESTY